VKFYNSSVLKAEERSRILDPSFSLAFTAGRVVIEKRKAKRKIAAEYFNQ